MACLALPRIAVRVLCTRFFLLSLLTLTSGFSSLAHAVERHALIIGNSAYGSGFTLANPQNDTNAIAAKLDSIGYKVHQSRALHDLTLEAFENQIDAFLSSIPNGSNTFIYYAGHGAASNGVNYLIPILPDGVTLRSEADIRNRSVSLQSVLDRVSRRNNAGVNVLFVDACRDAPVIDERSINMSGLTSLDNRYQPQGTFIGFSTEYGRLAVDGTSEESQYSPFASAVLDNLDKRASAPIELFYKAVSDDVYRSTDGKQFPIQEPKIRGSYCIVECSTLNNQTEAFTATAPTQPQSPPLEPQSSNNTLKIVGGIAAILIAGALISSGGGDGGSGEAADGNYTVTLIPPGR